MPTSPPLPTARKDDQPASGQALSPLRAFLVYGSVPVGGIAVALLLGTCALLGLRPSAPLVLLGFCGAFLVYQLDRSLWMGPEDRLNQPERVAWVRRHRRWIWTSSGLAVATALFTLPFLQPRTLAAGALLGGLGMLYGMPLPGGRRLKAFWPLKPLLIAAVWATGATVLPVIEAGLAVTSGVGALALYRFLFILPNALLADGPDVEGDRRAGLRTAATEFSPEALRGLAALSLGLAIGGALVAVWFLGASPLLYVDLGGPVLLLGFLWHRPGGARWFYGFVLDAVIAWPALTALVDLLIPS
ncbi:MAG: UbiA family prenyltransferase [Rhodothermales bacterium]